jgi:hypothetical protein
MTEPKLSADEYDAHTLANNEVIVPAVYFGVCCINTGSECRDVIEKIEERAREREATGQPVGVVQY